MIFRSIEPDRPGVSLWIDRETMQLAILGDPDARAAGVFDVEQNAAAIAAALRNMKTYARGSGESPTKWERRLVDRLGEPDGWIGIHATEHAVSVHLGSERDELIVNYVHLSPYAAGVLARELER